MHIIHADDKERLAVENGDMAYLIDLSINLIKPMPQSEFSDSHDYLHSLAEFFDFDSEAIMNLDKWWYDGIDDIKK